MEIQVPLNRLKFGHDDGAGINARVAGRTDGIDELAANIFARGLIENLVVKKSDGDFYSVANGNRRLAALHKMHGPNSDKPIPCTLREVDEAGAFEDSLTTAVTAKQLHPVDQYEAFARLKENDKTDEEIAREYGLTKKQVSQALALGALSPAVREAWRKGELKAEAAQVFTLADHKHQDEVLAKLKKELAEGHLYDGVIDDDDVRWELNVDDDDVGELLRFVGIEAYEAKKGKVLVRDLFGLNHKVSNPALLKKLADEKLAAVCDELVKVHGWSFAVLKKSVRNTYNYKQTTVEPQPTSEEQARLDEIDGIIGRDKALMVEDLEGVALQAFREREQIERAIVDRAYTPALRAKSGCFVEIDGYGELRIEYGKIKQAEAKAVAAIEKTERKKLPSTQAGVNDDTKPRAAPSNVLSNALKQRLESQLHKAIQDTLSHVAQTGDGLLAELARVAASLMRPGEMFHMPDGLRTKLPVILAALPAKEFCDAMAKRFDASDYFANAPKVLNVKAIKESLDDMTARTVADKTKAEVGKFALTNLAKTGWLPKELRSPHYAGPGTDGYKKPAGTVPAIAKAAVADATKPANRKNPPAKSVPKKAAKKKKAA